MATEPFPIQLASGVVLNALVYRGKPGDAALLLGHGAGAPQLSPFMVQFASAMAERGVTTITFNFPYMEQGRRVPDQRPVLDACYQSVVALVRREICRQPQRLFIGGKSMGGRIATHIAAADAELPISGLVLLGYPLHPPGRLDKARDAHLPDIKRPVLIVQGSRDTFGTPAELEPVLARMKPEPTLHVVPGGDHSFKVSKGGAAAQRDTMAGIYDTAAAWIAAVAKS